MPSGPAQPPPPEQPHSPREDDLSSTPAVEQDGPEHRPEERSGPLTITRVVKDDGRSLILYGHDESQAELEDALAREGERRDGPA